MNPQIGIIRVRSPLNDADFRSLLSFSPPEKQDRILRQRVKQNADNMAVGAALAKYMICREFCIPPNRQAIAYGPFGKPYLQDYPHANFNISHSGQYVACAVYDCPVGIDIQIIQPYHADVARRICTSEELAGLNFSLNPANTFTKLWAEKEAYCKMRGCGIGVGLRALGQCGKSAIHSFAFEDLYAAIAVHSLRDGQLGDRLRVDSLFGNCWVELADVLPAITAIR